MKNFLDVLKNNPLFGSLSEDAIAEVVKITGARTKTVKADEYILRVGDTTSELGVVLSGSVLIIQEDLWGRRNIISRITAGDVFAEVFAAASAALNVSVVAHEDGEILFLDVNRLLSLQENGGVCGDVVVRSLIAVLAKKTLAFNEKITHISRRTTKEKLLSYLSAQSVRHGSLSFDIEFNRQQLADYLCVERAAMSVELSGLQKEGILTYNRNHFELTRIAEI